jgi:hypothetical protein
MNTEQDIAQRYAVAVLSSITRQWVMVTQTFGSEEEANAYIGRLPGMQTWLIPLGQQPLAGRPPAQPEAEPRVELDHNRLQFARFLVQSGRLVG